MKSRLVMALTLMMAAPVYADSLLPDAQMANVQLSDPAKEREAKALMETIRCLVCQGQSIEHWPFAHRAAANRREQALPSSA